MNIWEQNKYKVHQIDSSLSKRKSTWILICVSCQNERIGTYCQAWNIVKNYSSGNCSRCLERPSNSGNFKRGFSPWNKGKPYNANAINFSEIRKEYYKVFDFVFTTPENRRLRNTSKYIELRKFVFKRDNYTCQICSVRGGDLEMDHIKEWRNYPELRFEEKNCRILCKPCHKKTDNYMYKAKKKVI